MVPQVALALVELLDRLVVLVQVVLVVLLDKTATLAELHFIIPLKLIPQTPTRVQEI